MLSRGQEVLRRRGLRAAAFKAIAEIQARAEHAWHQLRGPYTFVVDGVPHTQLVHLYNRTWRNERAVEIPLAKAFLDQRPGPVLELGNVLANYGRTGHVVVDKYEQHTGVLNIDIVDFDPGVRFERIVALSTLEHVGWDEEPRDPAKIPRTVRHLRRLLLPSGRLLVTCPLSYNPYLDGLIGTDAMSADYQIYLVRHQGVWSQTDQTTAFAGAHMGRHGGTAVWVAEFAPS